MCLLLPSSSHLSATPEHLPESLWQRLKPAMPIIATLLAAFIVMAGAAGYANQQRLMAQDALQRAEQQTQVAEQQRSEADKQRTIAEQQRNDANRQRTIAQQQQTAATQQARIAKEQTQIAGSQRNEATRQRETAEQQTQLANNQRQQADQQRRIAEKQTTLAQQQTRLAEDQRQSATQQTLIASLREKAAVVLNMLPTRRAVDGMVLAMQTMGEASKQPQQVAKQVLNPVQSSLLAAVQSVKEKNLLLGHTSSVTSVAFSPDGKTIASGSEDNTVRLWDLQGQPIGQPFQGHTNFVTSVAFSPDGKTIASGSADNTVRLWLGDWEGWLQAACNHLRFHPVLRNPESSAEPQVARAAKQTCEQQVWGRQNFGSR